MREERNILKIIIDDEIGLEKVTADLARQTAYSDDEAGSLSFQAESTVSN